MSPASAAPTRCCARLGATRRRRCHSTVGASHSLAAPEPAHPEHMAGGATPFDTVGAVAVTVRCTRLFNHSGGSTLIAPATHVTALSGRLDEPQLAWSPPNRRSGPHGAKSPGLQTDLGLFHREQHVATRNGP